MSDHLRRSLTSKKWGSDRPIKIVDEQNMRMDRPLLTMDEHLLKMLAIIDLGRLYRENGGLDHLMEISEQQEVLPPT